MSAGLAASDTDDGMNSAAPNCQRRLCPQRFVAAIHWRETQPSRSMETNLNSRRKPAKSLLEGLNRGQADAVKTLSGPLLVLAGAGTGKTRVVTVRISELIRHGTPADRILAMTFTNKAAKEMLERVSGLIPKKSKKRPQISTFHSLCVRILRRHATKLGYPAAFTICDRGDQESFARQVLRELRCPSDSLRPGDLLARISGWKNGGLKPAAAIASAISDKDHIAATGYRRYQQALHASGAVDFDDLLGLSEDLFYQFADVRREEAERFDHLLVDEYQDTNETQYRIIKALASGHRNLCVVGDDDQSIYGWRGAEVKHILGFARDWPDAKVVRLEENYRCTGEIIDLANRLIVFNKDRHDKVLRAARGPGLRPRILQFPNETQEAIQVVSDIRRHLEEPGVTPGSFAILFRTNEQPRPFESELRKAKIPYVLIGGMSFFDRREVKDVLSFLRVVARPQDEVSLLRIINSPPRGFGSKKVSELLEKAVKQGRTLWDFLESPGTDVRLSSAAKQGWGALKSAIAQAQATIKTKGLTVAANQLIEQVGYRQELQRLYPDENDRETRWNSVEQVINSMAEYERDNAKPDLVEFLDSVSLGDREFDNEKDKQLKRDAVVLMTLHSAKGLEFPSVYLVGLEEEILPHHRSLADETEAAIDEERRLCYVGITRAQEELTLSMALTRMKWGKPRDTIASRFLFEMSGQADRAPHKKRKRAVENARKRPSKSPRKRTV